MIQKQLNHYTIIEPLGHGGMGDVYIAEDTRLHRRVALKVLSGLTAADPERRARFEREARAVAALNHPNIVTIHSVEEADGVPFLTMELVEGRLLSALIVGGGMPVDVLLKTAIGISDAISAAHQRGITHRDLKPANVMVTYDGRVKVLDFGLAKLREAELDTEGVTHMPASDLTGEGRIMGTVAYMSPEQAEGKAVDQRSDIFSLGVMLHEMATGDRPFKGDTNVSVMSAILKDTPSSITDTHPNLPPGLAKIIRRALAKDPTRRYQTATDLRNELEELKQEIDSAVTVSVAAARPAASRPATSRTWIVASAIAFVILGLAAAVYFKSGAQSGAAVTMFELDRFARLTSSGTAQIAAISPDGRYVVHIKADGPQSALWIRQTATLSDVQIVPPANVRYDGLTFAPDGNFIYYVTYESTGGVASLYRVPVLGGTPQRVLEDIDSRVSFSPDAQQVAFIRGAPSEGRNYLMVAGVGGGDAKRLGQLEPPDQIQLHAPSWSPDGKTVLMGVQSLRDGPHNAAFAVDVATGGARNLGGRWAFVHDMEWMPDGGSFIVSATEFGGQTPQLWQVMFPGGERHRITNDLNSYVGISVAKDGHSLATVQVENSSNIWISPAADPAGLRQITTGQGRDGLAGLCWSSATRVVYTSMVSGHPEIWVMDTDGHNQRQLTNGPQPSLNPSATRDGRYVVYQQVLAAGMYLYRVGSDGSNAIQLTKGGTEFQPIVSPDGQWVYYNSPASGQPRPFRVSINGGEAESLGAFYFRPADVSADGTTIVGLSWDEAARRSRLAVLPAAGGSPSLLPFDVNSGAVWSPDGRSVTYLDVQQRPANLWSRELQGGTPRQLTRLPPGNVYGAAWSPDGKAIAVARGTGSSDVVIVTATRHTP